MSYARKDINSMQLTTLSYKQLNRTFWYSGAAVSKEPVYAMRLIHLLFVTSVSARACILHFRGNNFLDIACVLHDPEKYIKGVTLLTQITQAPFEWATRVKKSPFFK